jgi:hypothetical protein
MRLPESRFAILIWTDEPKISEVSCGRFFSRRQFLRE